jgi:hypothetical protein
VTGARTGLDDAVAAETCNHSVQGASLLGDRVRSAPQRHGTLGILVGLPATSSCRCCGWWGSVGWADSWAIEAMGTQLLAADQRVRVTPGKRRRRHRSTPARTGWSQHAVAVSATGRRFAAAFVTRTTAWTR